MYDAILRCDVMWCGVLRCRERDVDDLTGRLHESEAVLQAERRRHEADDAANRRKLGAALAEGVEAQSLAEDLKARLKVRE